MKGLQRFTLALICLIYCSVLSATNPIPVPESDLSNVTVEYFLDMKYTTFKHITGKKGNIATRLKFAATKEYLSYQLRRNNAELNSDYNEAAGGFNFKWGAFFLGLFLNLLGIVFVLLFYNRPRKNAVLSWLIGFLIGSGGLGIFYR